VSQAGRGSGTKKGENLDDLLMWLGIEDDEIDDLVLRLKWMRQRKD
jgi:hypothetical protein